MTRSIVVGLDNGGTKNNATVLDATGKFLVDRLVETPSLVHEGPEAAIEALVDSLDNILALCGLPRGDVSAVGLDTPGPASALRRHLIQRLDQFFRARVVGLRHPHGPAGRLGLPVIYNNDANAAALYAHHAFFGSDAPTRSSVSVIVGTGLGGGLVERGLIVRGAAGMAAELGHVQIPLAGLLEIDQPIPACNCGLTGDAESIASLTGIAKNLLPYWLGRHTGHELTDLPLGEAAKLVRGYGERHDPVARQIFRQQAIALGRLYSIAANFTDPHAYFLGGGIVETTAEFRDWFLDTVRANTTLRDEQRVASTFALVPDRDMAGARGAALAAAAPALS